MKKTALGLGLVLVVIVGGLLLLAGNLNSIVKSLIESEGSRAMGVAVTVGSVDIDLASGRAAILDVSVANPAGYSDNDMIRFDELSVLIDINSLTTDLPRINSIVARNPFVRVEGQGSVTNLSVVSDKLAADSPAETGESTQQLAIDQITIEGIAATLQSNLFPSELDVSLGSINLSNLQGTPEEISAQVVRPLMQQLSGNAAREMARASARLLDQGLEQAAQQAERLKENLDEKVGDKVREGLGNLIGR
ncbi:MAG: hypothetical protein RQ899_02405 [Pseudomonadales bacterium]|nr:hypothetical protein [Pseudomonadales bacterium]